MVREKGVAGWRESIYSEYEYVGHKGDTFNGFEHIWLP